MSSPISRTMTPREWLLLLVLSVMWGGSFFFVGIAVNDLPPITIVALRVSIAAVILVAVLALRGEHLPRTRAAWGAFFGMGLLNNVIPFSLIVWGQTQIPSGLASICNATTPLWTVVIAHFLTTDEKMTPARLAGVGLGIAGVAALIGPQAFGAVGGSGWGELAVIAAAVSYGFSGIFGRRFRRLGLAPMTSAAGQLTAASIMLVPLSLAIDQPFTLPLPGGAAIAAVLALAILSTAVAYQIFFRLLAGAGATNASLVTLLVPAWAMILGTTLLGEALSPSHFVGLGLIVLGLVTIDGRVFRFRRTGAAQ